MAHESYIATYDVEGEKVALRDFFDKIIKNYRPIVAYDIPLKGEEGGVFVYDINDTAVIFRLPILDRETVNGFGDIDIFGSAENIRRTKSELETKTQFSLIKLGKKEQMEK